MKINYLCLLGLLILGCDATFDLGIRGGQGGSDSGAFADSATGGQVAVGTAVGGPVGAVAVCGDGQDCRLVTGRCGDGVVEGNERCDDGVNDGSYGTCNSDCSVAPHCGDGVRNGPEECDMGHENGVPGSNCLHDCKLPIK